MTKKFFASNANDLNSVSLRYQQDSDYYEDGTDARDDRQCFSEDYGGNRHGNYYFSQENHGRSHR